MRRELVVLVLRCTAPLICPLCGPGSTCGEVTVSSPLHLSAERQIGDMLARSMTCVTHSRSQDTHSHTHTDAKAHMVSSGFVTSSDIVDSKSSSYL